MEMNGEYQQQYGDLMMISWEYHETLEFAFWPFNSLRK